MLNLLIFVLLIISLQNIHPHLVEVQYTLRIITSKLAFLAGNYPLCSLAATV
jgi:hypothetical protein